MIGCSKASGAFALDFSNPRHNARKPAIELAPPTSTPNSVRRITGEVASASSFSALSPGGAAATTAGSGSATAGLAASPDSISVPAAGSGGAIMDLDSTSGVAGIAPGLVVTLATDDVLAGRCSALAVAVAFSGGAAGLVATGATSGAGAGGSLCVEAGDGAAAGGAAAFCRAIAPVTESRPCSSMVTRV